MNKLITRQARLALITSILFLLSGCNTLGGAVKDVEVVGKMAIRGIEYVVVKPVVAVKDKVVEVLEVVSTTDEKQPHKHKYK